MKRINKNKKFWVIAYDITDDLRRSRLVKVIEKFGVRVNYSVFECMLTDVQLCKLQEKVDKLILPSEDNVIYYPLCLECYSKIIYSPARYVKPRVVTVV
ncbi:CRISPR-associated endonuclease Cas2 [Phocaeicola barnesiae]|uniref:CRISPR-associated endonuclease Cas2 n=1 Tax=Phocaeicola barnesiae TaxID=376804 RepID=UPI00242B8931|nr:CRISPR-associated endonuclease Cas2 [Phocaeicola barnesiae]